MIALTLLKAILKFCITNKFLNLKMYHSLERFKSQICDLSASKHILDFNSKYAGANWMERKQILLNSSKS